MSYVGLPNITDVQAVFCGAGVRPGGRATFVSAKVAKTSDAPSGLMQGTDASLRRADQLAPLKQGPPEDESVLPWASRQASGLRSNLVPQHFLIPVELGSA